MKKIAIIVPFHLSLRDVLRRYQVPAHLDENIERIFVYDGILENLNENTDYSDIKNTIVLSNKLANGAGGCRNIGLASTNCEKIIFCDSDDFINFDALHDIVLDSPPADIIYCFSNSKFGDINGEDAYRHIGYNECIEKYISSHDGEDLKTVYVPWSKIFDREFLVKHSIHFNEVEASNDAVFSIRALLQANKIQATKRSFYTVIDHPKSLTKNLTSSSVWCRLNQLIEYNLLIREKTNWKLHPMSAQILLCFKASLVLGLKSILLVYSHRLPIFYSLKHLLRIIHRQGFKLLK